MLQHECTGKYYVQSNKTETLTQIHDSTLVNYREQALDNIRHGDIKQNRCYQWLEGVDKERYCVMAQNLYWDDEKILGLDSDDGYISL